MRCNAFMDTEIRESVCDSYSRCKSCCIHRFGLVTQLVEESPKGASVSQVRVLPSPPLNFILEANNESW